MRNQEPRTKKPRCQEPKNKDKTKPRIKEGIQKKIQNLKGSLNFSETL